MSQGPSAITTTIANGAKCERTICVRVVLGSQTRSQRTRLLCLQCGHSTIHRATNAFQHLLRKVSIFNSVEVRQLVAQSKLSSQREMLHFSERAILSGHDPTAVHSIIANVGPELSSTVPIKRGKGQLLCALYHSVLECQQYEKVLKVLHPLPLRPAGGGNIGYR